MVGESRLAARIGEQVACEREKAGETKRRIDVAFQNIEGEVVEAGEGPHREDEQGGHAECGPLEKQQCRGQQTQEEEKQGFEFDPERAGEVFHCEDSLERICRCGEGDELQAIPRMSQTATVTCGVETHDTLL
jgi:hypothetical protein